MKRRSKHLGASLMTAAAISIMSAPRRNRAKAVQITSLHLAVSSFILFSIDHYENDPDLVLSTIY